MPRKEWYLLEVGDRVQTRNGVVGFIAEKLENQKVRLSTGNGNTYICNLQACKFIDDRVESFVEDCAIQCIVRYGKNGHKYIWITPSQEKTNNLISKYGADQICDFTLWLNQ